jgi:membrane protein
LSNRLRAAGRRISRSALGDAVLVAYQTRIAGLAAEASFWTVFALPWLILGLVAGISRVQGALDVDAVETFRVTVLDVAAQVLTPEAIDEVVVPLLDSVFGRGQTTLGVLGVLIAVWAGSRVIDALTNGMTIVYQREGLRSFVRGKVLSLGMYIGGLTGLIVAIPLVLTGPGFVVSYVPGVQSSAVPILLAMAEVGVALIVVVSLYHWAVPHRTRWIADLPGALVAIGLWVVFSGLLRWYFAWIFREGSVYGVIAAPVAVMWWVYVTVFALLLGAAFNGALAIRKGWFVHPGKAAPASLPPEAEAPERDG